MRFTEATIRQWQIVSPQYLEYSEKDDRFRLAAEGFRPWIINLSRIKECQALETEVCTTHQVFRYTQSLIMELADERGALERVLLHFSHLEKETKRLDDTHYQITLHYDKNDETEMLIRKTGGVVHSGDITHSDAAEYIDIDLDASIREIYANVNLFYGKYSFKGVKTCYVGMMAVDKIGAEIKHYDPACAGQRSSVHSISGDGRKQNGDHPAEYPQLRCFDRKRSSQLFFRDVSRCAW